MNEVKTVPDLPTELARYRNEGKNYVAKCAVANEVASTQTNLLETCARKIKAATTDDRLVLAHFASAYFKRGRQQKEELISLLHSNDVQLVSGVLTLLAYTVDLGPNNQWQLDKALGGSEIASHIAGVMKIHPNLGPSVASTLGIYGSAARGEGNTLLRIMLTQNEIGCFGAKVALQQVDANGLYAKFGLDPLENPLTPEQRMQIEKYLRDRGEM